MTERPARFREIGRVVGAKGVIGELKVAPETDDPARFLELDSVFIGTDPETAEHFVIETAQIRPSRFGPTVILTLAGVASRAAAETLCKRRVFASEEDLPAPATGEYFLSDLIGLDVFDTDSVRIGRVEDVYDMPGHDVLVIRTDDGREAMIPAVPEFLKELDLESGRLVVSLIEGLL